MLGKFLLLAGIEPLKKEIGKVAYIKIQKTPPNKDYIFFALAAYSTQNPILVTLFHSLNKLLNTKLF